MKKAMTLTYEVGNNLYLNITNQCPCNCVFCIRKNDDGAYESDPLWLEHEPSLSEMQSAIQKRNISSYAEIVVCGYGEPTMRLSFLYDLCAWLKSEYPGIYIRLNTNGLTALYYPIKDQSAPALLVPVIDEFSISLNAGSPEIYNQVTKPRNLPDHAYDTMLKFALDCKQLGAKVCFTVVDVIPPEEIQKAQEKADACGIPLHVRNYIR